MSQNNHFCYSMVQSQNSKFQQDSSRYWRRYLHFLRHISYHQTIQKSNPRPYHQKTGSASLFIVQKKTINITLPAWNLYNASKVVSYDPPVCFVTHHCRYVTFYLDLGSVNSISVSFCSQQLLSQPITKVWLIIQLWMIGDTENWGSRFFINVTAAFRIHGYENWGLLLFVHDIDK